MTGTRAQLVRGEDSASHSYPRLSLRNDDVQEIGDRYERPKRATEKSKPKITPQAINYIIPSVFVVLCCCVRGGNRLSILPRQGDADLQRSLQISGPFQCHPSIPVHILPPSANPQIWGWIIIMLQNGPLSRHDDQQLNYLANLIFKLRHAGRAVKLGCA